MATTAARQKSARRMADAAPHAHQHPVAAVEASGLTKFYDDEPALAGVTLTIRPGERVALLGANGAGKSTLLRLMALLERPTEGRLRLFGLHPSANATEIRRRLGVVGHRSYLYGDLTARENLRFFGRLYDLPNLDGRIVEALARVGLTPRAAERVRTFSAGMRQRLAIARATLHQPSLLLLDEPDASLDRSAAGDLARLLGVDASPGHLWPTIVLATHDLGCAEALCTRHIHLARGRIVNDSAAALAVAERPEVCAARARHAVDDGEEP